MTAGLMHNSTDPNSANELEGRYIYSADRTAVLSSKIKRWGQVYLLALFHCMVRHGTVRYGSLLGGFPLGTVPGTWYFFSTTSVEVPCKPYRYQNVTCKLC